MAWTLYRYILVDVLKVLVPATAVLVLVIAFALAIKPLADGVLGAGLLIKFVLYTIPTVLGFALPFAAALASTLVFIRMASDNEITAAAASGISYARILLPVLALGLVLTMSLFVLANFVVPPFYRYAERTVQADVVTALVNQLNQNRPFTFEDGLVVYADNANVRDLDQTDRPRLNRRSAANPRSWIELAGFAGMKLDRNGDVQGEATARTADIVVSESERRAWANITLHDYLAYRINPKAGNDSWTRKSGQRFAGRLRLNRPFEDEPKYLSYSELQTLRRQPQRFDRVQRAMENLAQALARARLQRLLKSQLTSDQPGGARVTLNGPEPAGRYILHAPRVTETDAGLRLEAQDDRPVLIDYQQDGEPKRRYEASRASLTLPEDTESDTQQSVLALRRRRTDPTPTISLQLNNVRIYASQATTRPAQKQTHTLPGMTWPGPVFDQINLDQPGRLRVEPLRRLATTAPFQSLATVQAAGAELGNALHRLNQQIFAQFHQRAASAIACLLLLVLGAVLSMQLKAQMPLVVYLWSFLLAIFTLIIIHASGRQMAGSGEHALWEALAVMWSGNLLLTIVIGVMYCRLARH